MLPVHAPFVWALQNHSPALSLAQWCALGTQALTGPPPPLAMAQAAGRAPASALAAVRAGSRVPSVRASLAVRLLEHSTDAADFTARWNLLNDAIASHHATRLEWDGTSALRLRHAYRTSGSLAPSHWLVAGAVAAGLSRLGIRVVLGGLEFAHGTIKGHPLQVQIHGQAEDDVVMELVGAASCARPMQPPALDLPASAPAVLQPVLQALLQEPGERWTLERAAAHAGMSPRSLQRVLASECVTWPQVVRALRVQAAGDLVLARNTSLTRIAHAVGFSDSAHLSRCFHTAAGLSPSAYRAMAHGRSRWRGVMG